MEDAKLIEGVGLFRSFRGGISWKKVSEFMDGARSKRQCMLRWDDAFGPTRDSPTFRCCFPDDTPWLEEDNKALVDAVMSFEGEVPNWEAISISGMQGLRSPQQCQKHWVENLQSLKMMKNDHWTPEEDELLREAFQAFNFPADRSDDISKNKKIDWQEISKVFNGERSANQCLRRCASLRIYFPSESDGTLFERKLGPWDVEEDAKLLNIISSLPPKNHISWAKITREFGGTRAAKQCQDRYFNVLQFIDSEKQFVRNSGFWKDWEDAKLLEAVGLFRGQGNRGGIAWQKVVDHMGNIRTKKQCIKRWDDVFNPECCLYDHRRPFPDDTPWTEGDKKVLTNAVLSYTARKGANKPVDPNWDEISTNAMKGLRSAEQCRQFWTDQLEPNTVVVKQDLWTAEEDMMLREAFKAYPIPTDRANLKMKFKKRDWVELSKVFNGHRTPSQCQRRSHFLNLHALLMSPEEEIDLIERKIGPWDPEEDARLLEIINNLSDKTYIPWKTVGMEFGATRGYKQCQDRYCNVLQFQTEGGKSDARNSGFWKDYEDAKLLDAVGLFRGQGIRRGIPWKKVVEHMGGIRSQKQCIKRWDDVFNPNCCIYDHRRPFSDDAPWLEEDVKALTDAVLSYNAQALDVDWEAISTTAMKCLRSPEQCEVFWVGHLKEHHQVYWTPDEDEVLKETLITLNLNNVRLNNQHWERVSECMLTEFGVKKSKGECRQRWENTHSIKAMKKRKETMEAKSIDMVSDGYEQITMMSMSQQPKKKRRIRKCTITMVDPSLRDIDDDQDNEMMDDDKPVAFDRYMVGNYSNI